MRDLPTRFAAFGEMPADRKCNELGSGPSDASTGLLKFVAAHKRKKSAGVKRENFGSRESTEQGARETSRNQASQARERPNENFRLGAVFSPFASLRLGDRQGFKHTTLKPKAIRADLSRRARPLNSKCVQSSRRRSREGPSNVSRRDEEDHVRSS